MEGDMSQPSADRIDIHACTKEMDGGRVPHGMRADRFCFERRHRQAGLRHDSAHQVVDAETGERLAPIVEEDGVMHSAISHRPCDHGCGCWPEWTIASLASYPHQSNRWSISERKIRYDQVSGFVNTSAGVVEKEQQGMVTDYLFCALIGCLQHGVHLGFVEIRHHGFRGFLERNGANLSAPGNVLRAVHADELG